VVERLVIDRVGHFGDGVALLDGASVYVPYTLGGETVEVAPAPGHHPDRRRLLAVERASAARISASAAAARSSTGKLRPTVRGNAISSSPRWRRRSSTAKWMP
jgi:tRNA/tmRNA/rRNA uracil-C5-methylase (TrmA/RlmC/RlmD family)